MTVTEVASLLRVKRSWVYANADFLGAYRLGKYLRFSRTELFTRLRNENSSKLGSQPNEPKKARWNREVRRHRNKRGTECA